MTFYYTIIKNHTTRLIKNKLVTKEQLSLVKDHYLVDGFKYPEMPVITSDKPLEISLCKWGFIPPSITDTGHAQAYLKQYNTLNVSSNQIFESKMYRETIIKNRCLVLSSGFFEWRIHNNRNYPYFISLKDNETFVFAGVWEEWHERDTGKINRTFSLIATEANKLITKINDTKKTMPVIFEPEQAHKWLDINLKEDQIEKLLSPISETKLKAHPVKKFTPSNKENNVPEVIEQFHYPELDELK